MAFTKAGLWGPEAVIDATGHALPGATAAVYLSDGVTLASLWTTSAKSVVMANPTQADVHGNLHFYADPGPYVLKITVGGTVSTLTVEVPIDPGEAAQDQDVTAAIATAEAYADGIVAAALAAALAGSQPLDADLTAIAALSTTAYGRAFLALADAAAGRTALGLGTAATHAVGDFDAAGAAAAAAAALVNSAPGTLDTLNELATALADDPAFATTMTNALAGKQPLDSDLTAIAALSTTAFGRSALALADSAALRVLAGTVIGTDVQAHDSDLDAIAALTTTAFGRALLVLADAAALRTAAGLGTAATAATTDFDAAGTASAAITALINGAPGALDTLNELATALGDDAAFATTVTNALATKLIAGATSGTANQAALPAAVAHTREIVKTDDGGVYLSTGSSWVEVVPPSLKLAPTAVKTGNYTAAVGDYVQCDTSGGIFTVTLPTAPADKTSIAVDLVASGNTLTIARGGADVFQKAGGPTSLTMNTANRVLVLQYQTSIAVWHVQDHLPAVITTKGDLLTYGTERARLAVGADGALLGADSTQTTGLKWIPSGTYALTNDTRAVIDLRAYGIIDGAATSPNGAANYAAIRAALTAAPSGAILTLPVPVTGFYVEQPAVGTCFPVTKDVTVRGAHGTNAKIKFGPENAGFAIVGFEPAAGVAVTFEDINLEGPDAPNGKSHVGVLHDASTGAEGSVTLRRDVRMTKWSFNVKADGDLTLGNSSNLVEVGPGCFLQTNGLGSNVLHLGGRIITDKSATFDMTGSPASTVHNLYLEPFVAADIDGRFLGTGGFGVHCFGGIALVLNSATANFTQADVGVTTTVSGAGANGSLLTTSVQSVQSATKCTLNGMAFTGVTGATVTINGVSRATDGTMMLNPSPGQFKIRGDFSKATPTSACVLTNPACPTEITHAVMDNQTGDAVRTQNDTSVVGCVITTPNGSIGPQVGTNGHQITVQGGHIGCQFLLGNSVSNMDMKIGGISHRTTGAKPPIVASSTNSRVSMANSVMHDSDGASGGEFFRISGGAILRLSRNVIHNGPRTFTLTSPGGAAFTAADIGATVTVTGGGPASGLLTSVILQVLSNYRAILKDACSQTATACTITVGGVQRATDGIMAGAASFLGAFVTGAGSGLEGENNVWDIDTNGWAADANALGNSAPKRGVGANVASTANLVLGANADVYHVTGTSAITSVFLQSTSANNQRLHAARVTLIADGLFTISGAGNAPAWTPAVADAITLQYDPNTAKWYKA